ncbi:TATA box-binding protein-associated factor RNA polymerase I subunit B [Phymastichus coffea]|uniref:TATA box-binding protein-associated factor RNA polymerase I subunit B n=1 Tax=Phymastichus coffea TaxID=108790 RepID=UPI00273CB518|nr:TATA box-binding protein-associated factor RNA polymerase I subunit B [Phymastichus coffea]
MLSQSQNAQTCVVCGGNNFFKEDGYFFCSKCQTQNEEIREEIHDTKYDPTTRLRKTRVKNKKLNDNNDVIGWTSWELYNLVLIGLINELIEIGADPKIKLTVLQLWTYYLSKLEVSFTSKTKKCIPRMARRFHKKDADIIYGKIQQRKRKRKQNKSNTSASSMNSIFKSDGSTSVRELNKNKKLLAAAEYDNYVQSQASSDNDGMSSLNQSLMSLKSSISQSSSTAIRIKYTKKAKSEAKKIKVLSMKLPRQKRMEYRRTHVTTQYAIGPDIITPMKLWSMIYLALRINCQEIHLADMLRFSKEGHLSYYKLDHLLPPEVALTKTDVHLLTQNSDITHKGMRRTIASLAKFLNVKEFPTPNLLGLIERYCEDLTLPKGIMLYVTRVFLSSPSQMRFTHKSSLFPNYEGRAMAYIIVVLKVLFGLDDITEKEISHVTDKINRVANEKEILTSRLFSFCEWQNYIECRKTVLVNLHYPSKIKYDPERVGTSHLYLRFMGLMKSKRDAEPPEILNFKHVLPQSLVDAFYQSMDKLNDTTIPLREMEVFAPSFTPLRSYIAQLLDNPHYDIPRILRINFQETKVGFMTKPYMLTELASQCGIELNIVDRSLQYLEKIVPPFEQPRMPSLKTLSELVEVENSSLNIETKLPKSESLLDYSHKTRPCKMKINFENLKQLNTVRHKVPELDETFNLEEDSGFDQILPDGRLKIFENSDSDNEVSEVELEAHEFNWTDTSCLLKPEFSVKYNIKLYNHEIDSILNAKTILKDKYIPVRDKTGKFVKVASRNLRRNQKSFSKTETEQAEESSEDENKVPKRRAKRKKSKDISQNIVEDDLTQNPIDCLDLADSDISILQDDNYENKNLENAPMNDTETLFRPYKNYWMYHGIFSRVKNKNFELFERELPENFLWLLNECASIVEMTTEDLYEEVCLIEAYHFNILKSKESKDDIDYEFYDCKSKSYSNNILNKW